MLLRHQRRSRRALRSWNFWTPITGTVYRIRAYHPVTGRLMRRAYIGRTMQNPWTKRIRGHLWGTSDTPAKPWADTVPGWRPDGTVDEVIAAGGAVAIFQFRMVPLILTWLEFWAIVWGRPMYNVQHNRNPRRITRAGAVAQRQQRDWGLPTRNHRSVPDLRLVGVGLLGFGVLLLVLLVMLS
jgi:hypothetical protein